METVETMKTAKAIVTIIRPEKKMVLTEAFKEAMLDLVEEHERVKKMREEKEKQEAEFASEQSSCQ